MWYGADEQINPLCDLQDARPAPPRDIIIVAHGTALKSLDLDCMGVQVCCRNIDRNRIIHQQMGHTRLVTLVGLDNDDDWRMLDEALFFVRGRTPVVRVLCPLFQPVMRPRGFLCLQVTQHGIEKLTHPLDFCLEWSIGIPRP